MIRPTTRRFGSQLHAMTLVFVVRCGFRAGSEALASRRLRFLCLLGIDGPGWDRTSGLGIKSPARRAETNCARLKRAANRAVHRCNELQPNAACGDKPVRARHAQCVDCMDNRINRETVGECDFRARLNNSLVDTAAGARRTLVIEAVDDRSRDFSLVGGARGAKPEANDVHLPALRSATPCDQRAHIAASGRGSESAPTRSHGLRRAGTQRGQAPHTRRVAQEQAVLAGRWRPRAAWPLAL
jgi:hypothetical protein